MCFKRRNVGTNGKRVKAHELLFSLNNDIYALYLEAKAIGSDEEQAFYWGLMSIIDEKCLEARKGDM